MLLWADLQGAERPSAARRARHSALVPGSSWRAGWGGRGPPPEFPQVQRERDWNGGEGEAGGGSSLEVALSSSGGACSGVGGTLGCVLESRPGNGKLCVFGGEPACCRRYCFLSGDGGGAAES